MKNLYSCNVEPTYEVPLNKSYRSVKECYSPLLTSLSCSFKLLYEGACYFNTAVEIAKRRATPSES